MSPAANQRPWDGRPFVEFKKGMVGCRSTGQQPNATAKNTRGAGNGLPAIKVPLPKSVWAGGRAWEEGAKAAAPRGRPTTPFRGIGLNTRPQTHPEEAAVAVRSNETARGPCAAPPRTTPAPTQFPQSHGTSIDGDDRWHDSEGFNCRLGIHLQGIGLTETAPVGGRGVYEGF